MERSINIIKEKSQDFDSFFFVRALPNEYLVEIGRKKARPVLGGKRFRPFRRFLKIPASVQVIKFTVNNHSKSYQGIEVEGYACWRIDPAKVDRAVMALDFYNPYDPLQKTSEDLGTICTEAIRHIIANLDIEEALKNKNGIAAQLQAHLKDIEERWGILFDKVGIERIRIMSDKVFCDLQAKERDKLRLDASLSRFETDRKIGDAGALFDRETQQTRLDTERQKKIVEFESQTEVKEKELDMRRKQLELEHEMERRQIEMRSRLELEKQEKELSLRRQTLQMEHELEMEKLQTGLLEARRQKELELALIEKEKASLERRLMAEKQSLELGRLAREIDNNVSRELVLMKLVEQLPACLGSFDINTLDVHVGSERIEQVIGRLVALFKEGA